MGLTGLRRVLTAVITAAMVLAQVPSSLWPTLLSAPEAAAANFEPARIRAASPVVSSTFAVGGGPRGVTIDPATNRAFVSNWGALAGTTVTVLQLGATPSATTTLATISVGTAPRRSAVSTGTNEVYVPNQTSGTVSVISIATNTVVATVPVGSGPVQGAYHAAERSVYIANNAGGGNVVSRINVDTRSVSSFTVPGFSLSGIAVNNVTGRVYATANSANALYVIENDAVTATVLLGTGANPSGVAVNELTGQIWVSVSTGVVLVDGDTNTVVHTFAVAAHEGLAINNGANRTYVPGGSGGFSVLDGELRTSTSLPAGDYPSEAAVAPSGLVVVTNTSGNNVTVLQQSVEGRISGIAACGAVTLPGATVELLSGSVVLATTTAGADGAYSFAGVAANATYTIRIRGSVRVPTADVEFPTVTFYTCGLTVTTDATGGATAGGGSTILNRKNHTWPAAFTVQPGTSLTDYIFRSGQSTWFKFPIRPGQRATVKVTDVPANYSVALYKDIRALYVAQAALVTGLDPLALDVIDASVAPDALSPDELSPDELSPDELSPDELSPDALSPDELSPDALSPDELSPDELSPDALSPDELSPDALSPDELSPDELSPDAYASAQTAALLGVSANVGLSPEQISRNTWDNTGFFYVRVRGDNGAFDPSRPFTLSVSVVDSACTGVTLPVFAPALPTAPGVSANGPVRTLILTNSARLGSDAALAARLTALAKHPRVNGLVIDLASQAGAAYAAWDAARTCPAAANAIAQGIRTLVNGHRAVDPIEHVVLVGGDTVIPFFRTPDQSGLGNERDYRPPVHDDTASQASLKLGYVLTQDPYASRVPISRYDHELYVPDLGIGRLVETPAQIGAVIDAFLASGGVVTPQRALVTGYDFLSDAALAMVADLAGSSVPTDADLVQPVGGKPTDPTAWTADQLRAKLFSGPRADIIALNGHFSANRALAADYATRLGSEEIAAVTDGRFRSTLVLSAGCHSGYNIVDGHALAVTQPLDFPQAFALQGATLIGGTGYQYGDTDFIKYTELILTKLVRELRYGSGPVSIGAALTAAKREYVRELAALRGIDEKALAVATLYGLPMAAIDLGSGRMARPGAPLGGALTTLASAGLSALDWSPSYSLTRNERTLTDLGGTATSTAVYYDIAGNVAVSPGTPVLPVLAQDVSRGGAAARGIVLRSAQYVDEAGIRPFTDVATIEVRGAHARYGTPVFTPVRPFDLNHFAGTTLVATPFQFRGEDTGTGRRFTTQQLRIYYSSRTDAAAVLGGAPVVYAVRLSPATGGVAVEVVAGASTAVGIEELLATYTAEAGSLYGKWASITLTGGAASTNGAGFVRTYSGTIPLVAGDDPAAVRVFAQAVGGNGLVTWSSNNGAFYRIVTETATAAAPKAATTVALVAPSAGVYLGTAPLSATLTRAGQPLAGKTVSFRAGGIRIDATTGADGAAAAVMPLLAAPGTATISVGFAEDATHLGSGADSPIAIAPAPTSFVAAAAAPIAVAPSAVIATLRTAGGRALGSQPITISGGGLVLATFTDGYGRVRLDAADGFRPGAYSVTATYAGNDRYLAAASFSATVRVTDAAVAVTGGGWIRTSAGDKATFSANVKYAGGIEPPIGHVNLSAERSGVSFKSVAIDRVHRTGDRVEIEGTGTLGKASGYRFRATLRDSATERFELRIWDAGSTAAAPRHHFANDLGGGEITIR